MYRWASAKRLVAPALNHHQVSEADLARAKEPCASRMNVVGTRHLHQTASLANQAPAHRQGQMHQLSGEQPILWTRVESGLQKPLLR